MKFARVAAMALPNFLLPGIVSRCPLAHLTYYVLCDPSTLQRIGVRKLTDVSLCSITIADAPWTEFGLWCVRRIEGSGVLKSRGLAATIASSGARPYGPSG